MDTQIQPRSENISIDPRYASRPILRLRCSVSFPNLGENLLDEHDDQPSLHPRQQRILAQSRPSTASKIPLSTLRTLSSDSTDVNTNRSFKHVRLQVSGEKLWLHRSAQDGSRESGEVCLKSYTLPAIVSAIVDSTRSPRTLKLGFLSGDLLLVRASSEKDWSHILRCLGPVRECSYKMTRTFQLNCIAHFRLSQAPTSRPAKHKSTGGLEVSRLRYIFFTTRLALIHSYCTKVYDRAVKSNLGLLPRPAKDQATTLSLRCELGYTCLSSCGRMLMAVHSTASVKCAETEDPPPAADVGAVKADANELADVSQGKAAILEAAAAMKQQKGPLMVSE